eukprot:739043-Alexandrium_andersonii.AAC.1
MRRHCRALAKASGDERMQADVAPQRAGTARIAGCGFIGFQAGLHALPVIGHDMRHKIVAAVLALHGRLGWAEAQRM